MLADHIGIPQLRDLAGKSERYSESLRIGNMSRLAKVLYPESDQADQRLELGVEFLGGRQGFPEISGHIDGSLDILCQRCLGPLVWNFSIDFQLVVIGDEADLDLVTEPFDAVIAGEQGISLTEIVEDELLTSLPLAPMHVDEENCGPAGETEIIDTAGEAPEVEMNRPFGDLATMLKDVDSPNEKN